MSNFKLNRPLLNGTFSGYPMPVRARETLLFWNSGWITGNPHLTRRWPFGHVTEGLPTIRKLRSIQCVTTPAAAGIYPQSALALGTFA
jgi:hypothetical protein